MRRGWTALRLSPIITVTRATRAASLKTFITGSSLSWVTPIIFSGRTTISAPWAPRWAIRPAYALAAVTATDVSVVIAASGSPRSVAARPTRTLADTGVSRKRRVPKPITANIIASAGTKSDAERRCQASAAAEGARLRINTTPQRPVSDTSCSSKRNSVCE